MRSSLVHVSTVSGCLLLDVDSLHSTCTTIICILCLDQDRVHYYLTRMYAQEVKYVIGSVIVVIAVNKKMPDLNK